MDRFLIFEEWILYLRDSFLQPMSPYLSLDSGHKKFMSIEMSKPVKSRLVSKTAFNRYLNVSHFFTCLSNPRHPPRTLLITGNLCNGGNTNPRRHIPPRNRR